MKKLLIFLCLILCLCILSGCQTVTDEFGNERGIRYGLVEINKVSGNGDSIVCYDPTTKICYMQVEGLYRLALSPYYIIGEDGKPEIAVYGVNYK